MPADAGSIPATSTNAAGAYLLSMLAQSWGQRKVGPSPLGSFGSFGRP